MKKRAIVTGGCGFIGKYLVEELLKNNFEVTVIDNLSKNIDQKLPKEVLFVKSDICNYDALCSLISEGDTIFHLAALTSVPGSIEDPLPYHKTNITGTYNVLEAARVRKAAGVIFSSSAAVYGSQEGVMSEDAATKPESPYALQKKIGEDLCNSYTLIYSLPTVVLRYFNVYGTGNNEAGAYAPVTARFLKAKREGLKLAIVGDGEQTRDFIHVADVAKANVSAVPLLTPKNFEVINVCSGISSRILDIATLVGGEIENLPPRNEIKHSLGDPSKFHRLIPKDEIISLEKGLRDMLSA
jgi:UDP-glucose 4-epimerase